MRKFYIIQRSEHQEWSADYVRSIIDRAAIYNRNITEKWVEEVADKHGCRIEWIGEPDETLE